MARVKKCKCCGQAIPEKPRVEVVTVEGISYTINHWEMGRTVDSPCSCFGGFRCHSTHNCPWMEQRDVLETMTDEDRAKYLCAREVTDAALRTWEGPLTAEQTNAIYKQVARVSMDSDNGVFTVSLVAGQRGSVRVNAVTNRSRTSWSGTVGPNGGVRKAA